MKSESKSQHVGKVTHHELKQTLGTWQLWRIAVGRVVSRHHPRILTSDLRAGSRGLSAGVALEGASALQDAASRDDCGRRGRHRRDL